MTWLEFADLGAWADFLTGLFPLVGAGFVLGLLPWVVGYLVASLFKALKGRF